MGKSVNTYIDLKDGIFLTPRNNAVVQLFNYPATLSDGTILGTQAVSSDGTVVTAYQASNRGRYKFRNIPSGKYYTVVVSGGGITSFIPEGFEKWAIPQAPDFTGTDFPWKDGEVDSVATKIENISVGSSTGINLGDGTGVFAQIVGSQFQFKTLKASGNTVLSSDSTTVTIYSAQDSTTNSRLSVLEASDIMQDVEIADLSASDGTQNTRLSVLESTDSTSAVTLSALISGQSSHSNSIASLQGSDGTQNTRLGVIESNYVTTATGVGTGEGVFVDKSGTTLRFKNLKQGSNISLSSDGTSITIAGSSSGEVNTASNLGAGAGMFAQKSGVDLQFKSLRASGDGTISSDSTTVIISRISPSKTRHVSPAFAGLGAPYYTTPILAVADSTSGDTIIVYPATYDGAGTSIVLKNGVNWFLHAGVELTNTSGSAIHTVTDNNVAVTCTISGYGKISRTGTGTGSAVCLQHASSAIKLFADYLNSSIGSNYLNGATLRLKGTNFVYCNRIDNTGTESSALVIESGTNYVTSREIISSSSYATGVLNGGNSLIDNCYISNTTSVKVLALDDAGTHRIINCRLTNGSAQACISYLGGMLILQNNKFETAYTYSVLANSTRDYKDYGGNVANKTTINLNNLITGTTFIVDTDVTV